MSTEAVAASSSFVAQPGGDVCGDETDRTGNVGRGEVFCFRFSITISGDCDPPRINSATVNAWLTPSTVWECQRSRFKQPGMAHNQPGALG